MIPQAGPLLDVGVGGPIARFIRWLLTRLLRLLRVEGASRVPEEGGALLVSNHVTPLDAFLISTALGRPLRHLLWRPLRGPGLPWLGRTFRRPAPAPAGSTRELLRCFEAAREEIRRGGLVSLFAEGARSRTGKVLGFRRALERVLRGLEAPVIPVAIDRVEGGLRPAGGWLSRLLRAPRRVTVVFGEPLHVGPSAFEVRRRVQELQAMAFGLRRRRSATLGARFIDCAWRSPFTIAMSDHTGRAVGFRRGLAGALALARALRGRLGPASNVGLLLPPSSGGALANAALALLGKVAVNLNYTAGPELVARCAARARVETVLTSRAFLEKLAFPPPRGHLFLEDLARAIGPLARVRAFLEALLLPPPVLKRLLPLETDPGAPAAVLFSSGTTGDPKGVVLSHFNIASNIESLAQVFELRRSDRVVGVLPFFHAFGLTTSVWLPLVTGVGALYHPNPLDARSVGKLVRERRGTLFMAPPSFFQLYIQKCEPEDFRSLRYAVSGAEKLRPETARAFEARFGLSLLEGYGCTELSPVAAVNSFTVEGDGEDRKPGTIGRPLPGVAVKLVDPETGAELPCGAEGLLLVKGPNVMSGYLDDPARTAEAIRDGWYVTGDLARFDDEGFIVITDRLSRFSKIAGEMVPHGKIEDLLAAAAPGVQFGVTSLPDEQRGERLAVVHTPLPEDLASSSLCSRLRGSSVPNLWLPRPDSFVEVEALPRTGTGKLDLRAVREIARERLEGAAARSA